MKKAAAYAVALAILFSLSRCRPTQTTLVSSQPRKNPLTVVVDAGHGGFDGGASTDDGVPEKDLNLRIALLTRDYLRFFGFPVVMTRETDCSVETEGTTVRERKVSDIHHRLDVMENTPDSVFVSIHQNHFEQKQYYGTQVFYSPPFSEQSAALAGCIQDAVVTTLQPSNTRRIKPCGSSVYLLYHAVKPAVLVECGFLSNDEEATRLQNERYQKQMSLCIAVGIVDYAGTERNTNG